MNQYILHNNKPTNNRCCSKQVKNFFTFMSIFTNVYTWCEVLQTSDYIKSSDHIKNTVTTYGYDLIFIWLVTFLLIKLQNIITLNKPEAPTLGLLLTNEPCKFASSNKPFSASVMYANSVGGLFSLDCQTDI